jgi:hypothetical protein
MDKANLAIVWKLSLPVIQALGADELDIVHNVLLPLIRRLKQG